MSNSVPSTPPNTISHPVPSTNPTRTLPDDRQPLEEFRYKAADIEKNQTHRTEPQNSREQPIYIIDWGINERSGTQPDSFPCVTELINHQDIHKVRIVYEFPLSYVECRI